MARRGGSNSEADQLDFILPDNIDAERFVLGAILAEGQTAYLSVSGIVATDDFSLEKHQRIWRAIEALSLRGEKLGRVEVANELTRIGQLQSVDGLSYLVALDDGLPHIYNLESFANIIREKSVYRQIIAAGRDAIDLGLALEGDAPEELAQKMALTFMNLAQSERKAGEGLVRMAHYANSDPEVPTRLQQPHLSQAGVATGIARFDDMTGGGFREGELWILAGRPAMGKSALCLNIAANIILRGPYVKRRAVAIFSLEMTRESLMHRLMCSRARIDQQKFRHGYLDPEEREALNAALFEFLESPLYIDDAAHLTIADFYVRCQRLQMELAGSDEELALVIIDYLQLMKGIGKFENRVQEISSITRRLKIASKVLKVPILCLSQLSRAPETRQGDHRPQLSDLRDSGTIEQDADGVLFVFREEVYRPDKESLRGIAELICGKQRNGPTGIIKLAWLNSYTKFENLSYDTDAGAAPGAPDYPQAPPVPAASPKVIQLPNSAYTATPFDEEQDDGETPDWFKRSDD